MKKEYVIKRNNDLQEFNKEKIENALIKAFYAMNEDTTFIAELLDKIVEKINLTPNNSIKIEDIQDIVEDELIDSQYKTVAKAYIRYRESHSEKRNILDNLLVETKKICKETDKLNANVRNSPAAKMLQAGGLLMKTLQKFTFPQEFELAHSNGDIHIHDKDFLLFTVNCLQIPAKRLLKEGFSNNNGYIRPAKHINVATEHIAILIQTCQNDMFGGQSIPSFDTALADFCTDDISDKEIYQSMQGLIYNLNAMHSRAGAQVPFSSLNIGLDTSKGGRRVTQFLLKAYADGLGKGETPIFPNVLFKVKAGVNRYPGDPNYDLFKKAIEVSSFRMNPTFVFMDTSFNSPYDSVDYMGCRTRVISNVNGKDTSESRGNLFFVTLNLPRIGILANHDVNDFFKLLDEKIDLCERQLMFRYKLVCKLKVKDLPFVMGQHLYMGSENLKPEDTIEEALRQGTLSMGFIGLAETLKALIGSHHGESEEALQLGLKIISHMKDKMDEMTKKTHLNFSLFATPAEGLSGRFTAIDRERFGKIEGVTDREYYTNSFHVPAYYHITHFKKIAIEGQFHKFCLAGHISYVEFDAPPTHNLLAVEKELNHMADSDVGYAGINFPIDYCPECGYQGIIEEDSCPACGHVGKIVRIRRVTGYLSPVNDMNNAKRSEVSDREKNR